MLLSVLLLASVSFEKTYIPIIPEGIAYGGAPSLNLSTSILNDDSILSSGFESVEPFAVLSDSTSVSPFSATTGNCTKAANSCFSFVFPGNGQELNVVPY